MLFDTFELFVTWTVKVAYTRIGEKTSNGLALNLPVYSNSILYRAIWEVILLMLIVEFWPSVCTSSSKLTHCLCPDSLVPGTLNALPPLYLCRNDKRPEYAIHHIEFSLTAPCPGLAPALGGGGGWREKGRDCWMLMWGLRIDGWVSGWHEWMRWVSGWHEWMRWVSGWGWGVVGSGIM